MRFGLFGSAEAGGDGGQRFHNYIDYNVEAEALGYRSSFLVEHHFSGWSQVSATLQLLNWVAARTTTLRVGSAVMVLPWHNSVLLAEQAATLDDVIVEPLPLQKPHPPLWGQERTLAVSRDPNRAGGSHILRYEGTDTERSMLYGMPDEITDKLDALRRAGISQVLLNIGGLSRDSMRTFARRIMPAFATA